ncbi:MAG: hypothetical protein QM564_00875 [Bergeyella sp.]
MNKRIILVVPHHFEMYNLMKKNLEKVGYDVVLLFVSDTKFRYRNLADRLRNFFLKTFFNDKNYKNFLRKNYNNAQLTACLKEIKVKVDYTLIIRPDFFSKEILESAKEKSKTIVAYQWDGLSRFPDVFKVIGVFDSFFVFDIDDYDNYKEQFPNIKPITNFYFDSEVCEIKEPFYEIFYLGSFIPNRMKSLIKIANICKNLNLKTNIVIRYFDKETPKQYKSENISYTQSQKNYTEVLQDVKNAKCLLDFSNDFHNGLSFRTFEALRFEKKLITNNQIIKNYDFYNPANIFVWNEDDIDSKNLEEFMKTPYKKIDEKIKQKYSFTNWINYVLDNPPYTEITNQL